VTVRSTELTDEASTGTVSCAWSCRGAEAESTAPKSHEEAPLPVPQPELNPGAPPTSGVACSRMAASGRSPPVAQALIFHSADVPRGLAECAATTLMHRLTGEVSRTVVASPCECRCFGCPAGLGVAEPRGDPEGVAVLPGEPTGLGEGEPVGDGECVRVLVGVADGECVKVRVGVADGECVRVRVGVGLG
jgi:hypothetical protein